MDYIVTRYGKSVLNISDDFLSSLSPSQELLKNDLQSYFSYSVYGNSSNWSKRNCQQTVPAGHVIVT
jgi:hypothetical protein